MKNQEGRKQNIVPIFIMGKRYNVPDSLTIQKAFEYAGYQLVRGCGCRGGICGACGTVYRYPESHKIEVGLACQTVVQPNMYITQIPFFPANHATYNIEELTPDIKVLQKLYPETFRCVSCNTCTKSCPMDIEVMDYMNACIRGDFEEAAKLSFDCVMCGLCTSRCPAETVQYHVAILTRRLYGRYIAPKSDHLANQVRYIKEGKFDDGMSRIKKMNEDELKALYKEREIEPEMAPEDWIPQNPDYLIN